MINLLIGAPGGGKSYEATVFHILPAVAKGRKVITNLPVNLAEFAAIDPAYPALIEVRTAAVKQSGTWDAERKPAYQKNVDGTSEPAAPGSRIFGTVHCYADDWKHPVHGWGPLYVIDECHVPLPKTGTPAAVEEWYALHRHYNADVLLLTQSYGKINTAIRDLVQVVYRVRKAIVLGKHNSYIRRVQDGIRGDVFNETERKYEPRFFKLYQSHTQGNAVAETDAQDVTPFLIKFRRASWVVLAAGIVFSISSIYNQVKPKAAPPPQRLAAKLEPETRLETVPTSVHLPNAATPATPATAQNLSKPAPPAEPPAPAGPPEPFGDKGVHLSGVMRMGGRAVYAFLVSQNGMPVVTMTDSEMLRAGYRWEPTTDCTGVLYWHDTPRVVTCDSPQIGMSVGASPKSNTQAHTARS